MSKKGGGRGVRRRRRKRGESKVSFRQRLMCGYRPVYKIKYDLSVGDVFKFVHRHKAVDVVREVHNARLRQNRRAGVTYNPSAFVEDYLDFSKGSFAIWMGDCWLTEHGPFFPRKYWWSQFVMEMEPVDMRNRMTVHLTVIDVKPRVVKSFRVQKLKRRTPEEPLKEKSFLDWIKQVFT